jgi:hypothetical protein
MPIARDIARVATRVCVQFLLLATVAHPLAAQLAPLLGPGTRVRVHHADPCCVTPVTGSLVSVSGDSLVLSWRLGRLALPRTAVQSLERGYDVGSRTTKGAFLGFLAGAAVGAATVLVTTDCQGDDICRRFTPVFAGIGAGIGSLAGAAVGAIIGRSIRREEWRSVPLPARVGFARMRSVTVAIGVPLAESREPTGGQIGR